MPTGTQVPQHFVGWRLLCYRRLNGVRSPVEERHERPEISGRYLDQFLEITALKKTLWAGGVKVKDIAQQYGVAPQTISAGRCAVKAGRPSPRLGERRIGI